MQDKKTLEFIEKAVKIHGNKYNYNDTQLKINKEKIKIICSEHGIFEQLPNNHLKGLGCGRCSGKRALTQAEIIEDFKKIHGDRYDYSLVDYKGTGIKVKIICSKHGMFEQTPSSHKQGGNCRICSGNTKGTTDNIIKSFIKIHGDEYDYSLVEYTGAKNKVKIICPIHGIFEQDPSNHKKGAKCGRCSGKRKLSISEIIEDFKKIHGDRYDYSLVEYLDSKIKIKIICSEHGMFEQTPSSHKKGSGCPKCYGKIKLETDEFIEKSKTIHGDRFDYSLVEYYNTTTKVKIICPIHGVFEQRPHDHYKGVGCARCSGKHKLNTSEIIIDFKAIHGDRYDYSLVEYKSSTNKVKIICPEHGMFEQPPSSHKQGQGCQKCGFESLANLKKYTQEDILIEFKRIHGDRYDYSLVEYLDSRLKVKIICSEHGMFEQPPASHKKGQGCPKCYGNYQLSTSEIIDSFKKVHGNKYDYSLVEYKNVDTKVKIICPIHGVFEQIPYNHKKGAGCHVCTGRGWLKSNKISLINQMGTSDLLTMDPFEIYTIIGQGKLPIEFGVLANTDAGSDERVTTLRELKERFTNQINDEDILIVPETNTLSNQDEIVPIDEIDEEVTTVIQHEIRLPQIHLVSDLHSLDSPQFSTMDKEAFESLIQYKLRKLWNNILNNDITIESIQNETGGEYFTTIKNLFIEEYNEVSHYQPKKGYRFKHQPNLMQKLTVLRLLKNKSYGNWSGTGAGKTLSFIVASREIESKLTVIIAINSTIKQTCTSIKEVYPNSLVYTDYQEGLIFDRTKHNYLVLNYEKFQQEYSEGLFQDLTNNNQIDFIVIDEVHNAKQRQEDDESKRREVMNRLLGRIREKNINLYLLAMSATPVVNNLYEAKSLLQLMTGLDYNDIDTRRTLNNALKIFQQLILNGLRFIPKYDIEMSELTGSNMTNLNIDGGYLLEQILELPQSNYIAIEKLLVDDKLKAITPYLRKGVILYSYFTTGFINEIETYVKSQGFSVGTYTGEESPYIREENLAKFIAGELDILIGSRPIGTGVDGLQGVSDRMILLTLPWTDSEYTQLKGRIYRQGSLFGSVEIIIPQVRINLVDGDFWSWDVQRLNVIKNKKTLADAAVDGIVPSRVLPTPDTMFRKSQESLQRWKDRVNGGNLIELTRNNMQIDLYPEIADDEQRQARIQSELSEFNRRGKTTKSSTMHKEFTDSPDSWHRYHALRKERMGQWDEVPYEYIATKIRNRNHKVVDFGCGENLFRNCISHNEVISFDHIAIDESVIACDMKDVSKWVENESVDVCVFSLALWGTNYKDYIYEAYRILNYGGVIHIAEPAKDYETPELEQELKGLIEEVGFKVVGDIERRNKFIYITGIKM